MDFIKENLVLVLIAAVLLVFIILFVVLSLKKKNKPQQAKVVKEEIKEEAKETPVKEEVKAEPVSKETPKVEKPKAEKEEAPKEKSTKPVKYHISQNKDDKSEHFKKWRVRKEGSNKTIKFFNTQKEAIEFAESLAENANTSIVIHKVDGSIRKQDYTKK